MKSIHFDNLVTFVLLALYTYMLVSVYVSDIIVLIYHFRFARSRRPGIILPIVPLSFIMAYQLDLAFGNKMERIVGT